MLSAGRVLTGVLLASLITATWMTSRATAADVVGCEPNFRRGDVSQDGHVRTFDPVLTLRFLYLDDLTVPDCLDAMDSNDDGHLDIVDPLHGLFYVFLGGPPPPDPGPTECGPDLTPDELDCVSYVGCPGGAPGSPCGPGDCCPEGTYCAKEPGECDGPGTCREIPLGCPDVWDPVCGCDGQTYGNDCEAAAAGVSVAHAGPCKISACSGNADCEDDEYCARADGDCEGFGVCQDRPAVCPLVYDPVCGCDGNTYGNACEAAAAGVSVAHRGECRLETCTSRRDCPSDSYCSRQEGDCDGPGLCKPIPQGCPEIFDPVCGCDGNTYANACFAAAAGVGVASQGPCPATTQNDCKEDADCPGGSFCSRPTGECEGVGVCRELPEACPEIYDPVCGCDGNTYSNSCFAAAAGVSIAHEGPCVVQPTPCSSSADCSLGEYCARPEGQCDGEGVCQDRPEFCIQVYDPVCGCDGNTYSNACFAAAAGVNVFHRGDCKRPGTCQDDSACPEGFYCAKEDCDGEGVCEARPDACIEIYDPVCGCDGNTYSNSCFAAAAGVNVTHDGPCVDIQVCQSDRECSAGAYCARKEGQCEGEGVCQERPGACPDVWDPVCGCDGNTYGNACEAAAAGVNVARRGPCVSNPCFANGDCAANEYCAMPEGDCEGPGVCRERPDACPDVWDPVCGCDGRTYGNACEAATAGVNVADRGECNVAQPCVTNLDCDKEQYCAKVEGDCEGRGVCTPTPRACPEILDPVCGCDGETYDNACFAAAAGVNVAHRGRCIVAEPCVTTLDCDKGQYCARAPGDCAGRGICRPQPEACLQIYDPVCGCDGKTYGNACEAAVAGVNVLHRGVCNPPTCRTNQDCPADGYCAKAQEDCDGDGVCRARPSACPEIFDPVCGCDGKTYDNVCFAAAAGVNVAHRGPCVVNTTCDRNTDCPREDYCAKREGDCDGGGVCEERPKLCPAIYDPVCGCDGNTYGNACRAASVGVNVAHRGPCRPTPCVTDGDCTANEYCARTQGDCDGPGVCQAKPEICPEIYDPVCGCDGKTYGNACFAAAAGVNVAHRGPCVVNTTCDRNTDCPREDYCAKREGDCDGGGVCEERPKLCPAVYDPVCGCDGNTYGNACRAASVGVNVAHRGPCRPPSCAANGDCDGDEYCAKTQGDCDGAGVCRTRPAACPEIYDPVCGCDGNTYGNACRAASVGVNVAHRGPCVVVTSCDSNTDCPGEDYCARREGDCDGAGVCRTRPEFCPAIYDPVCGCDGNTYGNACRAASVGVNVAHRGPCRPPPCVADGDCDGDEYCAKTQGDCDGRGVCREKPTACPEIYDPVCGCDGETYGNACRAASVGVNVAHRGPCVVVTSCDSNTDCPREDYCARREGDCDGAGVCRTRPEFCPAIYDPVCGCDGNTYGNACRAASVGVNVAHRGPCRPPPCVADGDCDGDEYCAKTQGDCDGRGVCREKPTACPEIYDPVCGCDGETYGNACFAAAAGVNVAHRGPCVVVTGCDGNEDCPREDYCAKREGDCTGRGVCRTRPELCPAIYDPVCGCDGNTYGNACRAASVGVNVAYRGACRPPPCLSHEECPDDSYCATPRGECDRPGVCRLRPEICPEIYDPVCGCDGVTYANACFAAAAGVNVSRAGSCEPTGECRDNVDCPAGTYCAHEEGDCDGAGECRQRPDACILVYDPVCGCDGQTYSNACTAAAAGVNIVHRGPCVPAGCRTANDCPGGFYCARDEGDCDGIGICAERPSICPRIFAPVCGCDGQTYSNACEAAAAGVSIVYQGECRN